MYLLNPRAGSTVSQGGWIESSSLNPKGSLKFIIIVKKPEGISSDLGVTGEWVMVVRRSMNKTGVLKVYLVGTRRYAYRLHVRRAKVPEWVITAMNNIGEASIGFEDSTEEPTDPRAMLRGGSDLLGFLYRSADSRGSFLPTRASGLPLDLLAV